MKILKLVQTNAADIYYQCCIAGKPKFVSKRSRIFAAKITDANAPTVIRHLESMLNIGTVQSGYIVAEEVPE
jgi:hypothetical protein